jgi:hypothetical protein
MKFKQWQCQTCGVKARKDGSCPDKSCSNYRKGMRGCWKKKKIQSPVKKKRRWKKSPPTPRGSAVSLEKIDQDEKTEVHPKRCEGHPRTAAEHEGPAVMDARFLLMPEGKMVKHNTFFSSDSEAFSRTFEGQIRIRLKEKSVMLAEAIGEVRALQLFAAIASLIQQIPKGTRSKACFTEHHMMRVENIWIPALLRLGFSLAGSSRDQTRKLRELQKSGYCTQDLEQSIKEAETALMSWAAKVPAKV